MSIRIVNYGVGNVHSALKAFKKYSDNCTLTEDANELLSADGIVLPGVGSFAAGMRGLEERNLVSVIQEAHEKQIPILGICLGAQLLLDESEEFGVHAGLKLIPGRVVHFPDCNERIPHIGWNNIRPNQPWDSTILSDIGDEPEMYFVHSYIMQPVSPEHRLAETRYGNCTFTSVVKNGSTYGCQFHPEKSSTLGLRIVENFVHTCEKKL